MLENLSLPVVLESRVGPVMLRRVSAEDLDSIITLLSDVPVSASRGDVAFEADRLTYLLALQQVVADPANELLLAVDGSDVCWELCNSLASRGWPGEASRVCSSRPCECTAMPVLPALGPR